MARLYPEHMPGVWAFSYDLPDSGATVTLYKFASGDTRPRMQVRTRDRVFDAGEVANPRRFGTWGTLSQFQQWCRTFKNS